MELMDICKMVELFEGLSDTDLQQIITLCEERHYNEGDVIAAEKDPGEEMFIIQEGFVEVAIDSPEKMARKVIVNLGAGQTVGEMSLIDQGTRSATVRAISNPTIVHTISQRDFEALCEENTRVGYIVMRNIALDLSFRLRQRLLTDRRG